MIAQAAVRPRAGFAIFTLAMIAVFVRLGLWQLQRRTEKHALIAVLNERLASGLAVPIGTFPVAPLIFVPVKIRFDIRQMERPGAANRDAADARSAHCT
jgi:cytochrome oxidase assembly protein ShyY1